MNNKMCQLFRDIYADRMLVWSFAKKDFVKRFAGSYLGIVWAFVQPLLTIIVYWAVFQFGFRSGDVGDIPYGIWFIAGIVPWLFFAEAFTTASNAFLEYSYLVKKVVFNIDILPLVKVISALFIHIFFCILTMVVALFMGITPTLQWIQIFYYIICLIVFSYALGMITATVMVFFRDINQVINVILLIGMWGTPIAWQIEQMNMPQGLKMVFLANPMYYIIDGYRDSLFSNGWIWDKPGWTIYFWIITLVLIILGTYIYSKLNEHFADVL